MKTQKYRAKIKGYEGRTEWGYGQLIMNEQPDPADENDTITTYYIINNSIFDLFENKDFSIDIDTRFQVIGRDTIGRETRFGMSFTRAGIYEGDYIEYKGGDGKNGVGKIVYEKGEFFIKLGKKLTPLYSVVKERDDAVVIGNEFDDKDLIKSNKIFKRWFIDIPDSKSGDSGKYVENIELRTYNSGYSYGHIQPNYMSKEAAEKDANLIKGARVVERSIDIDDI